MDAIINYAFIMMIYLQMDNWPDFLCIHCSDKHSLFSEVISHTITIHSHEELKIDRLYIDPSTGKCHYRRKNYGFIPNTVNLKNGSITCNGDNEDVEIRYANQVNSEPKNHQTTEIPTDQVSEPLTFLESDNEQPTDGPSVNLGDFVSSAERAYRFLETNDPNSRIISSIYNFFEIVVSGIFPITNIALLLFLDTVDYFTAPCAK
ncbi:unnamed protein product, partial [Owenia fusiformis]